MVGSELIDVAMGLWHEPAFANAKEIQVPINLQFAAEPVQIATFLGKPGIAIVMKLRRQRCPGGFLNIISLTTFI